MLLRHGASAAVEGARKRMPVTCVSLVVIPSVANGARRRAWNVSMITPESGMGALSRERANLVHQLGRQVHAVAPRAPATGPAALPRKAPAPPSPPRPH